MTDEERQRQMDFILAQQAQFASQMQKAETRLSRLERVVKLIIRAGLRTRREVREQIAALVDAHLRTEESLARLADAQAHTDRRLDALLDVINQQRNGQS